MGEKGFEDHELIQFELNWVDKVCLAWYIIFSIIVIFIFLPYIRVFDGVWIWGMPRPAFGLVINAIFCAFIVLLTQLLYRHYFSKLDDNF